MFVKRLVSLIPAALYGWAHESAPKFGCANDQREPGRLDEMTTWGASHGAYAVGARRTPHILISTV